MLQGGDPTGTGRGGESGFEGQWSDVPLVLANGKRQLASNGGGKQFKDEFDSRLVHQGAGVSTSKWSSQ